MLWRSVLSARAPECQKNKYSGLDQYGTEPFEQQQFGTADTEGVNVQSASPRTLRVDFEGGFNALYNFLANSSNKGNNGNNVSDNNFPFGHKSGER